jgi:transketolase
MIVMRTVKGKGCSFCEGQVGSHNMPVTKEMAAEAIAKLGA